MASSKQKVIEKNREVEERLKVLAEIRAIRRQIAQSHGTFPEINSLIRQIREETASYCE
jgi:hypothetical protein